MAKEDTRPICTAAEPQIGQGFKARHPDSTVIARTSNPAYDDYQKGCPYCGFKWWVESADY